MRRHAPDVYGLPGAALFNLSEGSINSTLARHYARNQNPVSFFDETFETDAAATFYVVAVATVYDDALGSTRQALSDFYGGQPLHAAPMWKNLEHESLRQATRLVASQHDFLDLVVCTPIGQSRDVARAKCLSFAAEKVHREIGVSLFVIDSLGTPTENELDQRTFRDLRSATSGGLARDTVAVHCRPSDELLLGLPDILAWSYRQKLTRNDAAWFEPLRDHTEVKVL